MLKGGCSGGPVALVGFGNAVSFSLDTRTPTAEQVWPDRLTVSPDSPRADTALLHQDALPYAASDLFSLGCILRFLLQSAVTHPAVHCYADAAKLVQGYTSSLLSVSRRPVVSICITCILSHLCKHRQWAMQGYTKL